MRHQIPPTNAEHTDSPLSEAEGRLFSADFKETPFWQDAIGPSITLTDHLPSRADVVVIGSGYTGLHCALQTARAGRNTIVLEAGEPGEGCSTRNGGQISTSIKPTLTQLTKKFGHKRARAIRQEGETALSWIEDFLKAESIECDFVRNGRFHAAHTPAHYDRIAKQSEILCKQEGIESYAVPKHEQRTELGTDVYYGGIVFPRHASLHAGKYHHQLLTTALSAGAQVIPRCQVESVTRQDHSGNGERFTINTARGVIKASNVMIATNGYTSDLTPWLNRRIIPIGSYVIATEKIDQALVDELFPTHRIASDTCRVVYYYRASPDRSRILFGGRVSANETDPKNSGPLLHAQMCRIFPQLRDIKISHSWAGTVGYTFDTLAHTGVHDGMHYAMGYCGSGVSMASYLGMRAGQKIIGDADGKTALDNLPFPSRPLYSGKPWFLPPIVSWYQWRDKLEYTNASA